MIDINKLLESKRVEVKTTEIKVDKYFVKQYRVNNRLTQVALANILGVTKRTIENWEKGVNNINGSSAVLLKLLNDNPNLLQQLYSVKIVEGSTHVQNTVKKNRFIAFSQEEVYMLKRHAIEASPEIVLSGLYDTEEVKMHEALLNELSEALGETSVKVI